MANRVGGLVSWCAAAAWPPLYDLLKSYVHDRVIKMIDPYLELIPPEWLFRWGPTLVLVGIGLWLFFWTGRKKKPSAPRLDLLPNSQWFSPLQAIPVFVPENVHGQFTAWSVILENVKAEIHQLYTDSEMVKQETDEARLISERLRAAQQTHQQAVEKVLAEKSAPYQYLEEQLRKGDLIARGVPVPRTAGTAPKLIETSEWAGMHLDVENAVAYCERRYGGDQYNGVAIAKV